MYSRLICLRYMHDFYNITMYIRTYVATGKDRIFMPVRVVCQWCIYYIIYTCAYIRDVQSSWHLMEGTVDLDTLKTDPYIECVVYSIDSVYWQLKWSVASYMTSPLIWLTLDWYWVIEFVHTYVLDRLLGMGLAVSSSSSRWWWWCHLWITGSE